MENEMRGVLSRKKGFFAAWYKGSYSIKGNYLYEFELGANPLASEPIAMIDLTDGVFEDGALITGKPTSFVFHANNGKSHFFLAPTMNDKLKWMESVNSRNQKKQQQQQQQQQDQIQQIQHQQQQQAPQQYLQAPSNSSSSLKNSKDSTKSSEIVHEQDEKISILPFLESFTDSVIIGNIRGEIIAVNSATEKMFGYTKKEMESMQIVQIMPEPYKSQHDGYLFRHEKFGTEKLIGKIRNLKGERKNGDPFDIQISLGKLPTKGHFIATIREIDQQ